MKEAQENQRKKTSNLENQKGKLQAARKGKKKKAPAWIEEIDEAFEKTEKRLPASLKMPEQPEWVMNIYRELAKSIIPGVKWGGAGAFDASSLGALLGRFRGLADFFSGQVPLGPKTEEELAAGNKVLVDALRKKRLRMDQRGAKIVAARMEKQIEAARKLSSFGLNLASKQSHGDAVAFTKAFSKTADIKPDEFATAYTTTRRRRILLVLFSLQRVMGHFKSIRHLHDTLVKGMGGNKAGNFRAVAWSSSSL